jgi:hypothetical protein
LEKHGQFRFRTEAAQRVQGWRRVCRRQLAFDSGRNAGFSVLGNYESGCSSGLRDDLPYKNLLAKVDLPTAS